MLKVPPVSEISIWQVQKSSQGRCRQLSSGNSGENAARQMCAVTGSGRETPQPAAHSPCPSCRDPLDPSGPRDSTRQLLHLLQRETSRAAELWQGKSTSPHPRTSLLGCFLVAEKTHDLCAMPRQLPFSQHLREQEESHRPRVRDVAWQKTPLYPLPVNPFSPYRLSKEQVKLFIANKFSSWLTPP